MVIQRLLLTSISASIWGVEHPWICFGSGFIHSLSSSLLCTIVIPYSQSFQSTSNMATNMADLTVYNMPPSPPNWDRVGVFYISFCVTWTALLIAGMIFCVINHRVPILRVRGLPLSFSAIILLHVYWILGQITYPIGATMPTVLAYDVQYFGMGVYFPLGIALFQASNLRFLHVARTQKQQFASSETRTRAHCNGADSSWLCRLRNMDYMKRALTFIGIGMVIQVCIGAKL